MFRSSVVVLMLVLATPALAKADKKGKKPEEPLKIELCGLASFDAVFTKVAAIDERLTKARDLLGDARRDLNDALGSAKGTSLQEALADFKSQAGSQIVVRMQGTTPKIDARPNSPSSLLAAVDAVNGLTHGITGAMAELEAIPAEAAALATEVAALPKQLKSEAKAAGLKPTEIPAKLKIVKHDVEVAAALPEKAAAVVERMTGLLTTVGSLAGG